MMNAARVRQSSAKSLRKIPFRGRDSNATDGETDEEERKDSKGEEEGHPLHHPVDDDSFDVTVRVNVSQQFFGWLFALGNKVKIESPVRVVEQFENHIRAVLGCYK